MVYKANHAETISCKIELDLTLKMLDRKAGDFVELQEIFILEHQIKGEFPKILKVVESLKKENVFNKPQLAGVIDMSTVYLLLDKPKKASKYLLADLKTFEEELVGSDLDNNRLMKIYFNLVDNKLETLNNDINELFTLDLQPEEVIAKSKILKNILQIIDVRNKKRPTASYHDVRNKIVDLFKSVIKGKNIPVFEKLLL